MPPSNSNDDIMPHPQSPDRPSSEGLPAQLRVVQEQKDTFFAPMPLHPQVPLPTASPRPSAAAPTMAASLQEYASANEQSFNLINYNPDAMQCATHNDHHHFGRMGHHGSGYNAQFDYSQDSAGFYGYEQNALSYSNNNYNLTSNPLSPSCPRTYTTSMDLTGLPMTIPNSYESHPPAAYQIEPQRPHEAMDLADLGIDSQLVQQREESDPYAGYTDEEYAGTGNNTPYESDITRSSTPYDDPLLSSHKAGIEDDMDKDLPYAQYIYKALMAAPQQEMVLRDIYEWFKKFTNKAEDKGTKGWQNSIRHNLSMNGAFKKVDSPTEDKKGCMWRLTEDAIRNGVKSTTRYRSKQPNKRGHRTHPLPQRQASGAKGGQASRRSTRARRGHVRPLDTYRHEPYRSVPTYSAYTLDAPVPPYSPYFDSPTQSDHSFLDSPSDFSNSMSMPGMDLFNHDINNRSYSGTPFSSSQASMASGDSAYVDLPQNPMEPLFTNSPTPSSTLDEPRTPDSQVNLGWGDEAALAGRGDGFVYDMGTSGFPV